MEQHKDEDTSSVIAGRAVHEECWSWRGRRRDGGEEVLEDRAKHRAAGDENLDEGLYDSLQCVRLRD
jgi:hypothetical protein